MIQIARRGHGMKMDHLLMPEIVRVSGIFLRKQMKMKIKVKINKQRCVFDLPRLDAVVRLGMGTDDQGNLVYGYFRRVDLAEYTPMSRAEVEKILAYIQEMGRDPAKLTLLEVDRCLQSSSTSSSSLLQT